jgi:hypothetical protein
VGGLTRDTFVARGLILDEERRDAAVRLGDGEHPAQLVAVRTDPGERTRIGERHARGAKLPDVAREVVRLEAIVDQPAALLETLVPAMLRVRLVERDQLEIGAVGKGDERIVGAGRVPAARNDGEAQPAVAGDRTVELRYDDDEMIDPLENGRTPRRCQQCTKRLDGTEIPLALSSEMGFSRPSLEDGPTS